MQCFDHGEPYVALCGWCGKQMCQRCIARQDGRKKYCRACADKMTEFKPAERIEERVAEHLAAAPIPHDETKPRIEEVNTSPIKRKVTIGHRKAIDPRHFDLDENVHDEPIKKKEPPVEKPTLPIRPSFDPFPNATRGVSIPVPKRFEQPPVNLFKTEKPQSSISSPRETPTQSPQQAINSSARAAMNLFAMSAKETAANSRPPTQQVHHQSPNPIPQPRPSTMETNAFVPRNQVHHELPNSISHESKQTEHKSPPPQNSSQKAMNFFAMQAKETAKQPPQAQITPQPIQNQQNQTKPTSNPAGAAQKAFGFLAQSAKETKEKNSGN